jgi:hypothetical protein
MSTQISNTFTSYSLTSEELQQGSILTSLQKQCIQNQISALAEQKLRLKYDPVNPMTFLQEEAELQGQLIALQYLFTLSEAAEAQTNQASITL